MKIGRAWETLGRSWKNPPWKKPHSAHLRTLQGIVSTSSRPPFAELPPGTPWNPFVSFSSVFHQVSGFLTVILIIALSPGYLNIFSPSNYRSWSTWWYDMIWLTWAWVRIDLAMDPPTHTHTLCKTKALEKEVVKIEVSAGFCTFSIHWIPSICVQFALLIPFWSHDAC